MFSDTVGYVYSHAHRYTESILLHSVGRDILTEIKEIHKILGSGGEAMVLAVLLVSIFPYQELFSMHCPRTPSLAVRDIPVLANYTFARMDVSPL